VAVSFIDGGPWENHRPVASQRQLLSHTVVQNVHQTNIYYKSHVKYQQQCKISAIDHLFTIQKTLNHDKTIGY
jgi:hypothetical protein